MDKPRDSSIAIVAICSVTFTVYLAGTISAIARWTPTQSPMFKLVRWLQTVRNNSSFQQLSILLPSEQLVSQASSARGCVLQDKQMMRKPKPVLYNAVDKVRYSYMQIFIHVKLPSGL